MDNKQLITMNSKEAMRYEIIQELINKKISTKEASAKMRLSIRQVQRIKNKVIKFGIEGIIHANRGRVSNNKIDEAIIVRAKQLLHEKYYDFNPLLAQEHLFEDDQIKVSLETVRKWLIEEGLWKAKKRTKVKKHFWRERKDSYGEMIQFDGSYHSWFENRNKEELGLEQCLLVAVDDAKGTVTAKFAENEGVVAVFKFWQEYIKEKGLPLSIYLDRFSTYKVNYTNVLDDREVKTQFERAMAQLDIKIIHAKSAQAKGRVEKMNGTLQKRLPKEMRLANINTIEEANRFLKEVFIPKINAKFEVVAKKKGDLHRKPNNKQRDNLNKILSIQSDRVVNNDYTIRFKGNYYQLRDIQLVTVYKRDKVLVEEHLNGELKISLRDKYLDYFQLPERPKKEIDIKLVAITKTKPSNWIPPINHPWRKEFLNNKIRKV